MYASEEREGVVVVVEAVVEAVVVEAVVEAVVVLLVFVVVVVTLLSRRRLGCDLDNSLCWKDPSAVRCDSV